jgi:hypothetical protein
VNIKCIFGRSAWAEGAAENRVRVLDSIRPLLMQGFLGRCWSWRRRALHGRARSCRKRASRRCGLNKPLRKGSGAGVE